MPAVPLGDLISPVSRRVGNSVPPSVYSVTKHVGFVRSDQYFNKQVFSRDLANYREVHAGDFAYATIHLDEGSIGIAPERAAISPMYTTFRANEKRVNTGYLLRYLKSPRALAAYEGMGRGAVHRRKAISLATLSTLPIPLPPLAEQRRIAAILDRAELIVAANKKQVETQNSLPIAIISKLLAEAPELHHAQLGQFVTSAQIGLDRRTANRSRELPHAYVTMDAISKDGAFLPHRLTAVDATAAEREKFSLRHGDFIINTRNSRELVGKSTVFSGEEALFNNNLLRLRFDSDHLTSHFVSLYLYTPAGKKALESIKSGTTSVFATYAKDIYKLKIPMLHMGRQEYLIKAIHGLDSQRSLLVDRNNELNQLFAALQARAFRGEL